MYLYVRQVNLYKENRRAMEKGFLRRTLVLLALCGVAMGLAIASKWQGVYGALGLPLLFFPALYKLYTTEPRYEKHKTRITLVTCFAFFVAVPLVIYVLSYIPFMAAQGGGLRAAWANQGHMLSYHAELVAEHSFASPWWSWPLMIRPMWLYVNRISPTVNAGITSFGNPAIWWFGIAATGAAVAVIIKRLREKIIIRSHRRGKPFNQPSLYVPAFLLVAYAAQFLPWATVSRLTFIYHYFPSVPFVVLLITWFFKRYAKRPAVPVAYACVVAVLFMAFYPVLSGWPMDVMFVRTWLAWLPGWVFM
jgi:dolichyl-phosphate-mannose--protein O-mannosyl transferase